MVSGETNIILRHSTIVDPVSLLDDLIKVEGSISGVHGGELLLSDNNRTIIFNPYRAFAANEVVNVTLAEGVKTLSGGAIPKFSFSFETAPGGIVQMPNETF